MAASRSELAFRSARLPRRAPFNTAPADLTSVFDKSWTRSLDSDPSSWLNHFSVSCWRPRETVLACEFSGKSLIGFRRSIIRPVFLGRNYNTWRTARLQAEFCVPLQQWFQH